MEGFWEICKVEQAVVGEVFHYGADVCGGETAVEEKVILFESGGDVTREGGRFDPVCGDEDFLIELAALDSEVAVFCGDMRDVSADERFAMGDGFEEGKAEALLDRGGDKVSRVVHP